MPSASFPSLLRLPALLAVALAALAPSAAAQRGTQVNVSPITGLDILGDAGNEPSLAVSPVLPDQIAVGWRSFPVISSDSRWAGYAWSGDGGASFQSGGVLAPPPGMPPTVEQTDPVLTVDSAGVFRFWSEVFRPSFSLHLYHSFDGGMSWPMVTPVESVVTSGDKGWIVTDTTGGPGDGNLYGGWNNFNYGGQCFVRSTDGGATFTPAKRIADRSGTQWMLHFAVGPAGEVYAAWRNYLDDAIYVTKSTNAWNVGVTPTFDAFGPGGHDGLDLKIDDSNDPGFPVINPSGFHQVYVDVDRSNGPRSGWVYCVWADGRNDGADILLARSKDGGFTWETGFRVNDDLLGNGAFQWMPAMSVAPNGRIDVLWYDTRNDLADPFPESQLYYAWSGDGGATWSVNRRASDPFDTRIGWPVQQKIGDYIQSVSRQLDVSVAYAATFHGGQDVWFRRLRPTTLSIGNLTAGGTADVTVTGGRPNEDVWLAASLTGPGSTYVSGLNATVQLANPFEAAPRQTTDANGGATWRIPVAPGAAGRRVWAQALQREGGSQVVTAVVQ